MSETDNRWPDILQSPAAAAMRAGNIDYTDMLDLFDKMEREIRVHRGTFCEDPSRTHETPAAVSLLVAGEPVAEIVEATSPAAELIFGRDIKFFEALRTLPIGTRLYAAQIDIVVGGEAQSFDEIVENCLRLWFFNYDETADHSAERVAMREIVKFVASQYHVVGEAILDVFKERRRQVEIEGWTAEHDNKQEDRQLAVAASCYSYAAGRTENQRSFYGSPPPAWPWDDSWWKPTTHRRDLVKAAALIIAEIERLDRAALASAEVEG